MTGQPPPEKKVTTTSKPRVVIPGILVMWGQSQDLLHEAPPPADRSKEGCLRARPHRTSTATSSRPPPDGHTRRRRPCRRPSAPTAGRILIKLLPPLTSRSFEEKSHHRCAARSLPWGHRRRWWRGMEAGETRASEGRGRPGAGAVAPHGDGRGLGLGEGAHALAIFYLMHSTQGKQ
jgi:hypothetical protein